ncbi:xylulose 5-phosphate 3-epimerase [Verticiella sediminum]|uniref:Xylulose 5-phosphate 3-epimerase n=1 Tax=Verticiella sediminum TaxID=1247510 RepID=A0A556AYJ1_9BURK|nr:xylulose 5-phosphate 3-epimerase [Verticiella sediminum]TSH98009.1 xylulose 5-phosphate 3-epimerase [Verticiella sediminum]
MTSGSTKPLSPTGASAAEAAWRDGHGVIQHGKTTVARIVPLAQRLVAEGRAADEDAVYRVLAAADRLASAAMWLVVHMTYARRVDPDGALLAAADFKPDPEGHTGGALNMVMAYVGYLAANALSGSTRSWLMGQGHCVAAIEAVNVLVGNLSPAQVGRYDRTARGMSQLCQDFYSYAQGPDGAPATPLGSHVNANTAGGILEGGYLGFAEVQYTHMPLKGESLVAFLSDGAFEEQRGSDWSPRWWRASDSGALLPIMVLNGRRIEQRTEIVQGGGAPWLSRHLQLNGFEPIELDGQDPAAYAWVILEMESRLRDIERQLDAGEAGYPVPLPYAIAKCEKGYGFPGAGTNRAHNLPLSGNPSVDDAARQEFNTGAAALHVPPAALEEAVQALNQHRAQGRVREGDHPLARRRVPLPTAPAPGWVEPDGASGSPMQALDRYFIDLVRANPQLRVRVGNPDELRSNRMGGTLDLLKHRVNQPEADGPESLDGSVITALNEEAVIGAALGNKGGLSLAVTYEAFAVKMLGALRQEIIFTRHQRLAGQAPGWIGVPLVLTSHTWENGKNEQSHQDPTLAEALLGEMSDTARVLFPVDENSAVAAMRLIYETHAVIGALVVPKRAVPRLLSGEQAQIACRRGAVDVGVTEGTPVVQLVAVGAYQLDEAVRAARRLAERGCPARVTAVIEPGRLRTPRDELESEFVLGHHDLQSCFPAELPRVLVSHVRPEPLLGTLRRIDGGPQRMRALGYANRGGTLDVQGMLFANRCTWAHVVDAAAAVMGLPRERLLEPAEVVAVDGVGDPGVLRHE